MTLKNKKNVVGLDVLESVVDIESFDTEVGKPYGTHLGAEVQKTPSLTTVFDASTAHIEGPRWWMLAIQAAGHPFHAIASIKSVVLVAKWSDFWIPLPSQISLYQL